MARKARVAVVGLGRIGGGRDGGRDVPRNEPPRSHVGAVLRNPDLELVAVCDSNAASIVDSLPDLQDLSTKAYASLPEMLAAGHYDIVTIATPAETHESIALTCLAAKSSVRALFCEKPLGTSAASAGRVAAACREAGVALTVNYHRRWDDRIAQLRREIASSGGACHASFQFVKGLRNYGAHAIDLLRQLFGEIVEVQSRAPTAGMLFASGLCADLTVLGELDYEVFDLDILCRSARFRVIFGGQQIWRAQPHRDRFIPGYTVLGEEARVVHDAPAHGLTQAYAELASFVLNGFTPYTSTGENALATQQVIEAIEQSAGHGAVVRI